MLGLHPNISVPRAAFVTAELGGRLCLYIAYDFYAGAVTLEAAHLQPQVTANGLVQVSSYMINQPCKNWKTLHRLSPLLEFGFTARI